MVKVDIWVEGPADQKFLKDVLSVWFELDFQKMNGVVVFEGKNENRQIQVRIRAAGSVDAFISEKSWRNKKPDFQDNQTFGIKNLIVIDADNNFRTRKSEVAKTVKDVDFNAESDLFLWPNHQHWDKKGDLERLLEQIINPENKDIFACFEAYESCLRSIPGKTYITPKRKAKIFSYSEALSGDGNERNRNYTNPDHWQLDRTKEPLRPLYEFLKTHLG